MASVGVGNGGHWNGRDEAAAHSEGGGVGLFQRLESLDSWQRVNGGFMLRLR